MIGQASYARRASRDLLNWFELVRHEQPALAGRELYRQIIVRRCSVNEAAAERMIRKAEDSFSDWESDREPRFQDIALCVIFDEYQHKHGGGREVMTRMERVVARVIPARY